MPADAVNYSALAKELNQSLSGGRIDKIIMSDKSTIMLLVRAGGANHSLIITAGTQPRCYVTKRKITSTDVPLSFCLHLRRHIGGGNINSVECIPFERILIFKITAHGDLGEEIKRLMIVEIMGKYSNVVITDENYKITEALKHIGFEESRPIMPGLTYTMPTDFTRFLPTDEEATANIFGTVSSEELPNVMVKRLMGLSLSTAKEIIHVAISSNVSLAQATNILIDKPLSPVVYYDNGQPKDYAFCAYDTVDLQTKTFPTLSEAMDEYYSATCIMDEKTVLSNYIKRVVTSATDKQKKKLASFLRDYENAKNYEDERVLGELITANLYKIKSGDKFVIVDNWYNGTQTEIKLTERSAKEDAEKHFKRYQKKKRTVLNLEEQIANAKSAIDYLESIETALSLATDASDFEEISSELEDAGYIAKQNGKKKVTVSEPRKYEIDGFTVLVGKSNVQNDKITKEARGEDIWLHTQGFHGSHVIIKARGAVVPSECIIKCAEIAAFFSKARQSENVPVDYTHAKNVHKQRGAPPGKVDYFGAKTVFVSPKAPK